MGNWKSQAVAALLMLFVPFLLAAKIGSGSFSGGVTLSATSPIQVTNGAISVLDASTTQDGTVSTGTQTFAGAKTFNSSAGLAVTGVTGGDVNLAVTVPDRTLIGPTVNTALDFRDASSEVILYGGGVAMVNCINATGCYMGSTSTPLIVRGHIQNDQNNGLRFDNVPGLPSIANASLPVCTASTWDATHVGAGAMAFDSTNSAKVVCNGTRWVFEDLWKTCTMSSGTSCTATVPSGTVCVCMSSSATSSPLGSSCAVASTTATCTSTVTNSDVWNVVVH